MVALVSEALMEATWQATGAASGAQALRLQKACGKEQAELTGFVLAFSSALRPEAMGLVLYAHVVIAEAFRRCGAKFRHIKPAKVLRTWESIGNLVASLEQHGRSTVEQAAELVSEPAVFRYIVSAMDPDQEDPVDLSDNEFWRILRILQTVSQCMHDAQKTR